MKERQRIAARCIPFDGQGLAGLSAVSLFSELILWNNEEAVSEPFSLTLNDRVKFWRDV